MRRYKTKETEKKEYKTALGTTDYNIPMFGYRSAALIFGGETLIVILIIYICNLLKISMNWPLTILAPLSFSLLVGYSQFFLERKKGFVKGYFITVLLIFILFFTVFYLFIFKGIVI
ncbi:hypothetical protein [Oceanivirga salmonicida]|uniref:hypothetical protein n=1 Tax=Oceanivirga salmonicida TaxID=1769291 RepID=UPI000834FBD8|nr:hypothetical protein [Oceanivirga salmonicida]